MAVRWNSVNCPKCHNSSSPPPFQKLSLYLILKLCAALFYGVRTCELVRGKDRPRNEHVRDKGRTVRKYYPARVRENEQLFLGELSELDEIA